MAVVKFSFKHVVYIRAYPFQGQEPVAYLFKSKVSKSILRLVVLEHNITVAPVLGGGWRSYA